MSLLALLVSMAAQYAFPPRGRQVLLAFYGRVALAVSRRLDAGDRNSGIVAWLVLVAIVVGPVAVATALAAALHPVVVWILDVVVLYFSLRFLETTRELGAIERLLREGDATEGANGLAAWRGEPVDAPDADVVARLAAEHALRESHHGAFALLFWFLVLPGPIGLVLYPLAQRAARSWEPRPDPEGHDFGWFAARAFQLLDWIPQRLTACAFAVVGDFEDALFCWRSQAQQWPRADEAIVLAAGAGALGVRLGEPVPRAGGLHERPSLGVGDPAREETLASLEGLLWRAWILWMVVFLLAAALHAA